jgi:hypothetical protein
MKIGLIDVDGHNFPNLALMRLASFHRAKGDEVEWCFPFARYDRIYRSKVFTFTPDDLTTYQCDDIRDGGTGYDIKSRLPEEVERHTGLAYDLYPQYPFSVQFFSRGCVRHCPFCLVHDKEGDIHPVQPADLNPRGQWIEVLDNNFFANPEWREAVKTLQKTKLPVNLHGVDVRIIDEEQAASLNSLKLKKNIHIAWDLPQIDLTDKLTMMTKLIPAYKITCYVLVGFNSTREQDLHRLRTLKRLGILPFVQPYRDFTNNRQPTAYEKDLARWANRAWLFKSIDFADFRPRKGFCCKDYLF